MFFLHLFNANLWFTEKKFILKSYTTTKPLPITNKVELIDKKEFAKAALDKNSETFMIHIASILETISIYPVRGTQNALLQADKALIKILAKNSDYIDIFSPKLAMELPKTIGINENAIDSIEGKQSLYGPIYILSPVELKMLKTYI